MKTNKAIFRIIAIVVAIAITASFGGCIKAYNNDPTVLKCGSVKLGLQKYLSIFYNSSLYQYYSQGYITGENYNNYVMNELTKYGVELDQVKKQGITLTAEEEAKVKQDLEDQIKSYLKDNYASKIDSSITDEAAKYEAELNLFKAALKESGSNFKKYSDELEQSIRESALIDKLRDTVIGDITVDNDAIKKYFDDNTATDTTLTSFNSSFSNFFSGSTTAIPGYMPVVKAAEPASDDTEGDSDTEAAKPNPYDELFSVQHVLVKYEKEPNKDVRDYAAYAADDENLKTQMDFIESRLGEIGRDDFLNDFCHNSEVCEDDGMQKDFYQFFGYTMAESLISSYYDGFGNAAMMLKYPEWQPKDDSKEDTEETPYNFDYKRFTLQDGTEIIRMFSKAGVHYIVLTPNDWNCMYDPDTGMLRVVMYDGEEPVKDGSSYVTTAGNISEDVFNAIQEAYSHIGDKESESYTETNCKSVYDYYSNAALSAAQNEAYGAVYNEWKEDTKIVVKDNVVKAFISNMG